MYIQLMTGYTTHNEESRFANCIENKQAKKENNYWLW